MTRGSVDRQRRTARPIVADALLLPVAVIVGTCLVVLATLAVRLGGTTTAGRVDTEAKVLIQGWFGDHVEALRFVVHLGDARNVVAAALVIAVTCVLLGRFRLAILAVAGPAITGLTTTALQPAIGRTLDGGYALPSGHAGGLTALATVVGLLVITLAQANLRSTGLVALSGTVLAAFVMAVALVANNEHYWTDTVAGSCTAVAIVLGLALVLDLTLGRGAELLARVLDRRAPETDG